MSEVGVPTTMLVGLPADELTTGAPPVVSLSGALAGARAGAAAPWPIAPSLTALVAPDAQPASAAVPKTMATILRTVMGTPRCGDGGGGGTPRHALMECLAWTGRRRFAH